MHSSGDSLFDSIGFTFLVVDICCLTQKAPVVDDRGLLILLMTWVLFLFYPELFLLPFWVALST